MADVQRRRHGGEHRCVPARRRALGRGPSGRGSGAGERGERGERRDRLRRTAARVGRGIVAPDMSGANPHGRLFWGTTITVVILDVITKLLAETHLFPPHVPHRIIGDVVRFTLAY